MLICLSITQIVEYIYSIVDPDLYTICEEMFTLVELHRIRKKCSVKNKIKKQSNLNFFAWSKLILEHKLKQGFRTSETSTARISMCKLKIIQYRNNEAKT